MENDKQITGRNLEQIKNLFLSEELLAKNARPEVYSLSDEFAKSKKNRNILVYVLIILYIATIGAGAFLLTAIEENKSKRVEVNIAEFRQFNLIELLAEKKENEEKLAKLQQELDQLRTNSLKEIQKLSPRNQQKAIAELNEKMKQLEESLQRQISVKEESLKALEKSIINEQQRMIKTVQESQSQVKNYQNINQMQGAELVRLNAQHQAEIERLKKEHQLEIDNLKKDNQTLINTLTLRYNPIFTQGEMAAIINSKMGSGATGSLKKFDKTLLKPSVVNEQDFNQLRKKIQSQKIIIDSLQHVPYTNSVPAALNRLEQISQSIIDDYETLWSNLAEQLNVRNSYLSSFEYAFNYLAIIRSESGFVIDARNQNRMDIFIDRVYSVKNGDVAYIFKNDNSPIAKIELNVDRGRITARVKEILRPVKIEPFDKILLKLEVTQ
jgi:ribosomal protein L3